MGSGERRGGVRREERWGQARRWERINKEEGGESGQEEDRSLSPIFCSISPSLASFPKATLRSKASSSSNQRRRRRETTILLFFWGEGGGRRVLTGLDEVKEEDVDEIAILGVAFLLVDLERGVEDVMVPVVNDKLHLLRSA
eukprot:710791-Hanusia_phi.AAC.1